MDLNLQIFLVFLQRLAEIRCSVWLYFVAVFGYQNFNTMNKPIHIQV